MRANKVCKLGGFHIHVDGHNDTILIMGLWLINEARFIVLWLSGIGSALVTIRAITSTDSLLLNM